MNKKPVEQLLKEIDNFSRNRNLSKKELAKKLNIPYETLRKWFQKGIGKKTPSPTSIEKLEKFLESHKEIETYWTELWIKILEWWETQHRYSTISELADEIGWDVQSLSNYLQNIEMPPKLVIEKIAKTIGFKISSLDTIIQETLRKTEKVKHLLLFLEEELRWFRDGSEKVRDIFRNELDINDIGYISSLLTMLCDEDKFKRWLTLTTNRFNFLKKKGSKHESTY